MSTICLDWQITKTINKSNADTGKNKKDGKHSFAILSFCIFKNHSFAYANLNILQSNESCE